MQNHDWSRFVLYMPIKAAVQEIYDTWTTQAGLERFFLRQAPFTAPDGARKGNHDSAVKGDTYEWRWHGYPDETVERGTITTANGKDLLQFTFGKAGNVTVSIKTIEQETVVELVQENIPTDETSRVNYYIGCRGGWAFYLTNLKSLLEGGIDLRNRNTALTRQLGEVVNS